MPHAIVLAPEAVEDFKALRANIRAEVKTALETHLRREPAKASRSRIKKLRVQSRTQSTVTPHDRPAANRPEPPGTHTVPINEHRGIRSQAISRLRMHQLPSHA